MDGAILLWVTAGGCLLGGVVGLLFAALGWHNRDVSVALPYGLLSLSVGVWGVTQAGLLVVETTATGTAVSLASRVAVAVVPFAWFWFAVTYAGTGQLQNRSVLVAVGAPSAGYGLLLATAPVHELLAYRVDVVTRAGITAPVEPTDPVFWGFVVYTLVIVATGFLLLGWFLARSRAVYQRQTELIVAGSLVTMAGLAVTMSGVLPHPGLDLTPVAFAINGAFVALAWRRHDFMNLTPVSSDALVDELPDPVLVLDESAMVAEHNQAALEALGEETLIGEPAASVHPELSGRVGRSRIDVGERVFDVSVSGLDDRHGIADGHLVVLRDVTVQQRRLDRIEALQVLSQQFIEATTREAIGEAAVEFLETELDAAFAVVYAVVGGDLRPVAASETAEERGLVLEPPDDEQDHPLWPYAHDDEPQLVDPDVFADADDDTVIGVPLGDAGLLCLCLERQALADEDEQSVRILQGTMTAALSRVEREQRLGESRREIDRRTEQIKFFTGVLRHNIRNGMMVIRARADSLESRTDESGKSALETIARWSEDLLELTDKVGRITDVVTAVPEERRRPMDLAPVLEERTEAFDRTHDVALTRSIPEMVPAYANDLVGTVVDAVLENAVAHNDAIRPLVDVSVISNDEHVQVRISDDGPGIDDDLKESVFDREVGTGQTANGFGLYFVSLLMDFYGGDVWFEDRTEPVAAGATDVSFEYRRPSGRGPANEPDEERWGTVAVLQFRRAER